LVTGLLPDDLGHRRRVRSGANFGNLNYQQLLDVLDGERTVGRIFLQPHER
jgi:hypothetical protein